MDATTEPDTKPTELEMSKCKYRNTALQYGVTPLCLDCAGCLVMVSAIDAEFEALDADFQYELVSPAEGTKLLSREIQKAAYDIRKSEVPGPSFEHDEVGLAFVNIFDGMARLSEAIIGCIPIRLEEMKKDDSMKIPLFFYLLNKEFGI